MTLSLGNVKELLGSIHTKGLDMLLMSNTVKRIFGPFNNCWSSYVSFFFSFISQKISKIASSFLHDITKDYIVLMTIEEGNKPNNFHEDT